MTEQPGVAVPATAVAIIATEVRGYGHRRLETGGFLLLPRDTATVSTVAFAGAPGIVRRHNLFQISERALDRLFIFADDHDLQIPVQFHSHELGAFLSRTDAEHGLRVEGFTSVVIPTYSAPPVEISQWGWWCFTTGAWVSAVVPQIGHGAVTAVRFDEDRVHAN